MNIIYFILLNLIKYSQTQLISKNGDLSFLTGNGKNITFKTSNLIVNNESIDVLIELSKTSADDLKRKVLSSVSGVQDSVDKLELQISSLKTTADAITSLNDNLQKINSTLNTLLGSGTAVITPSKIRRAILLIRKTRRDFNILKLKLSRNECSNKKCRNGGTCIDLFDGYLCTCFDGWQGKNCEVDVDECANFEVTPDLGCQNGAKCVNTNGSYHCECSSDFRGVHCATRAVSCDEASDNELCDHGTCVDISQPVDGQPNYRCICDQGWTTDGRNGSACSVDINECDQSKPPCSVNPSVQCFNFRGGFRCGNCPPGFEGNGYYCADVDECLNDNGGCSIIPRVECTNTFGSRICGQCPKGFSGDGITCNQVSLCSINNGGCNSLATCIESVGGVDVVCQCPDAYFGNGFGVNGCIVRQSSVLCRSNPCIHGTCVAAAEDTSFACECFPGYSGTYCELDINECDSNPCLNGATCIDGVNSFQCICGVDWRGNTCNERREACGGRFVNAFGFIKYPLSNNTAIGGDSREGRSCFWVISTTDGKVLNLQFTTFNIHSAADCSNNFLQLFDGPDRNAPLLGKFCGSFDRLPNSGNITTNTQAVTLWLKTNDIQSNNVFTFSWNTSDHICGGTIESDFGTIRYPQNGGQYPKDTDCYWLLKVSTNKRIQIHFSQLAIEEHDDCKFDFVRIHDGEKTTDSSTEYCTSAKLLVPLTTLGSRALIHFHSDDVSSDLGFHLTFSALSSVDGCGGTFTQDKNIIRSPSFPLSYPTNLVCDYLIHVSDEDTISLTFTEFELELHPNCKSDYIEIFDGMTESSPLIGRYCSEHIRPPPKIRSSKNSLFIRFKSDGSISGKGFMGVYETVCDGYFTSLSGVLKSPGYPKKYPSNRECLYHIDVPVGNIVQLQFFDFVMEVSLDCRADYVEVREGIHRNSSLTNRFCGVNIPTLITSTFNELWIIFKSDATADFRGFYANYTTSTVNCGGVMKTYSGSIESPSHTDGGQCTWLIAAPPGFIIRLTFSVFLLPKIQGNCTSSVEVRDYDGSVIGKYCGNRVPPPIQSVGDSITVIFTRKEGKGEKVEGFAADYSFLNASKACGGTVVKKSGYITSPNYPNNYPNFRDCKWIIQAEKGQQIALEVKSFSLNPANCRRHYLELRNGQYDDSPLIGKYCGTKIPMFILSHSNALYLHFASGYSGAPGFEIFYSAAISGCGGTITQASGTIASPDYPSPYNHNAVCEWIIHVSHGSSVTVNLIDVDLEEHDACSLDSLEIFDGANDRSRLLRRICRSESNMVVNSSSNVILVKFRTDASVTRRGFRLTYSTNCVQTVKGFRGIIESPNFPDVANEDYNCSWKIEAPIGNTILLMFSHLNVSQNYNCSQSFVEVNELAIVGDKFQYKTLSKYCEYKFGKVPDPFNTSLNVATVNYAHLTKMMIFYRPRAIYRRPVRRRPSYPPSYFRLEWQAIGCGGDFIRKEYGSLLSPNYPEPYDKEAECLWHIRVPTGTVELSIDSITFESHNCSTNFLKIFSGPDLTSPLIATICDSKSYSKIDSTGRDMTVYYRTDGTSSTLFMAHFLVRRTSASDCGGSFNLINEGTIISRNYFHEYDVDEPFRDDCVWYIHVPYMHAIELSVSMFYIENNGSCANASLTVYDSYDIPLDDSGALLQLCDNKTLPTVRSSGSSMVVRLRNFLHEGGEGLRANFKSVCGGTKVIAVNDKTEYILLSSNYPHKSMNNRFCNWTLQAADPGEKILLTLTRLEFEVSFNCTENYVEIREGSSGEGPLIKRICGRRIPPPIISQGNALHVYMHSNGIFRAVFTTAITTCGGYMESESGVFTSPGYPNNYPLDTECVWWFYASYGNRFTLSFTDFHVEDNEYCNTDYVEVREQGWHGPLIGRYCGDTIPILTSNNSSTNSIWVKFRSDGFGTSAGFMAFYSLAHEIDLVGTEGFISSPRYPENYATNDDKFTWTITAPVGTGILVTFYDLQIPSLKNSETCANYLKISNSVGDPAFSLGKYCGYTPPEPLIVRSNFISIVYNSRRAGKFSLRWEANSTLLNYVPPVLKPKGNCGTLPRVIELNSTGVFELKSPGYPTGYDNGLNCSWIVKTLPGFHLLVKVLDMNIEGERCNFDKISFYDPIEFQSLSWKLNQTICGRDTPTLESSSNHLRIDFITDAVHSRPGFKLQLETICGGEIFEAAGVLSTETVQRTTFCEWKVKVRPGRTINVTFEELNIPILGGGAMCSKAYIILRNGASRNSPFLGEGRFCGDAAKAPVLSTLQTSSSNLFVQFSAPFEQHASFRLLFEEISLVCGDSIELNKIRTYVDIEAPQSSQDDVECDWIVRSPPNTIIRIDLRSFEGACNISQDYVEIRDGATMISHLLKKLCVPILAEEDRTFTTSNNMMFIRYATRNLAKSPFKARVKIDICGGTYHVYSTPLTITNGNYADVMAISLTCEWYLEASFSTEVIQITLTNYSFEGNPPDCDSGGFLYVKEVDDTGRFLGKFCEPSLNNSIVLRSSGPRIYLHFFSDKPGTRFSLIAESIYSPCGGVIAPAITGEITSPAFPNPYPFRRDCHWILKAPSDRRIRLTFEEYNLKPNVRMPGECLDQLRITKSPIPPSTGHDKLMPCNNVIPEPIESYTMGMTLTFITSGLDANEGFKARYTTDDEILCGGRLSDINAEIISYGFNETNFNETFYCLWTLASDEYYSSRTSSVVFDVFDIPQSQLISGDYFKCNDAALILGSGQEFSMRPDRNGFFCGDKTGLDFYYVFDTRAESFVFLFMNYSMGNKGVKGKLQVQECGGVFTMFPVNVSSPGFPKSYPPNSVCQWKLMSYHYGVQIKINFTSFELEKNCDKDYLVIRNGEYPDSPIIDTFCGTQVPDVPPNFALTLTFKTDSNGTAKGFNFLAQEISRTCGGVYQVMYGTIVSPNYGMSQYENNLECEWMVDTNPSYHLNFSFTGRFDIEISVKCSNDYVLIEESIDGKWKEVGRYCGRKATTGIVLKSHKARITFRTNRNIGGDGFMLTYDVSCGGLFTEDSGVITSPGYPDNYMNNLRCEYLIQLNNDDYISLKIDDLDIEGEATACLGDSLQVYKGNTTNAPIFGPYCGDSINLPPNLMNRGSFLLALTTDSSVNGKGFRASYHRYSCGGVLSEESGVITSPNDNGKYLRNMFCVWKINVKEKHVIELRFTALDLELCHECDCDGVFVYDSLNFTSEPISFCGSKLPAKVKSTNNVMTVVFHSNEYFEKTGFTVAYRTTLGEKQGCGGLLQNSTGVVESPKVGINGTYDYDLDCIWIIMTSENTVINVTFEMMDIEESAANGTKCAFDYLEMRDGSSHTDALIDYYCGSDIPQPIITSSNKLLIQFHSDDKLNYAGFRLRYETVNSSCGILLGVTVDTQILTSPNYPSSYSPLLRCFYDFRRTLNLKISIFTEFEFKFKDLDVSCEMGDYIEITPRDPRRLYIQGAVEPYRVCGKQVIPPIMTFPSVSMTFVSSADDRRRGRGFNLEYKVRSCNQSHTANSGYFEFFGRNEECIVNITTTVGSKISLYFDRLDMYGSKHFRVTCKEKKLEVIEGFTETYTSKKTLATICPGDPLPNPIFSSTNEVMLKFSKAYYEVNILYTSSNSPGCGGDIIAINGTFTSPNYPNAYSAERQCVWTVKSLGMHSLTLRFTALQFTSTVGCDTNFVELFDGLDMDDERKVARYCGNDTPAVYNSEGNTLVVKMVTNKNNVGIGFRAIFFTNDLALTSRNKVITSIGSTTP